MLMPFFSAGFVMKNFLKPREVFSRNSANPREKKASTLRLLSLSTMKTNPPRDCEWAVKAQRTQRVAATRTQAPAAHRSAESSSCALAKSSFPHVRLFI